MTNKGFIFVICLFICSIGCAQNDIYNQNNYIEFFRGTDTTKNKSLAHFEILFRNKSNPNYTMEKDYLDSLYHIQISEYFYLNNVLSGPFKTFINGKTYISGFMKNNEYDGERITYNEKGEIAQKAYYKEGIKVGTWEDYNDNGKLIKKSIYDETGNLKEVKKF